MSAWAELVSGLVFGVAMVVVACNYRDVAWRIPGFMSNTIGANRLLTPTIVRFVCGALATVSVVSVAFGLAGSE
ncbi:hypothetical protein B1R27_00720 [Streptomyces sp. GKU 895]|nr:hypothetical protein B1R27_00720 [Streptomyces sp. GKU 895]